MQGFGCTVDRVDAADDPVKLGTDLCSIGKALVGAGGISTWRFMAREPGEGRLLLTYQQPWEPNVPPAETFECEVRVK